MEERINIIVKKDNVYGNPHIEGTRSTVFDIVTACESNGLKKVLYDFEMSEKNLLIVLSYCESQICKIDYGFCGGCSLLDEHQGINTKEDFINCFAKIRFEDSCEVIYGDGDGLIIMPETSKELYQNWKGRDGWLIANKNKENLLNKHNIKDSMISKP